MTNDAIILDLASKLRIDIDRLQSGTLDTVAFCHSVHSFATQMADALHPHTPIPSQDQVNDGVKAFAKWCSSQRVVDLCEEHHILLDQKSYWWPLPNTTGYLAGLPHFHGTALVTNGIDVWFRTDCGQVVKGHLDWLRKDSTTEKKRALRVTTKQLKDIVASNASAEKIRAKLLAMITAE
jgi:hypothetical protein